MATEENVKGKENAILTALGSISKVLGKETECQQFLSYVNSAGLENMPSALDIASHTPTWVQLVMPSLSSLYNVAFRAGQRASSDWYLKDDTRNE